jgi:hypothetical protein
MSKGNLARVRAIETEIQHHLTGIGVSFRLSDEGMSLVEPYMAKRHAMTIEQLALEIRVIVESDW